jgi:putative transposase
VACRVLDVSKSGYYEWLGRPESPRALRDKELTKMIREIHDESRGTYGWPRVHAELTPGRGELVNHKRVARLMRAAGASTGVDAAVARSSTLLTSLLATW